MRTLIIAPHPDDETLACGGSILRRKSEGCEIAWLIVTGISESEGWSSERVKERKKEIKEIEKLFEFDYVYNLALPTARLDTLPISEMVGKFSEIFNEFMPDEVFLPHYSDVHSDHRVVFDVSMSCTKWFRFPFVKRVLAYETISETEFGLQPNSFFKPNLFIDVSEFLEKKMEAMSIYKTELDKFPHPRSLKAIQSLATLRGSNSGYNAAEAFQLLLERE